VARVRHPAARFHLVGVQTPEVELLLKQRATDVRGVVKLASAVVVEDLSEDARVAVEEVLQETQ